MASWIIIGIIVVCLIIFYKFTSFRYERFWTYIVAILMIFILFTFFSVVKHNDLDISDFDGFTKGTKFYMGWLWGFIKNAGQITGNVAKVDWSGNFSNNTTNIK